MIFYVAEKMVIPIPFHKVFPCHANIDNEILTKNKLFAKFGIYRFDLGHNSLFPLNE